LVLRLTTRNWRGLSKIIDRYLVNAIYFSDNLVFLSFHITVIAKP